MAHKKGDVLLATKRKRTEGYHLIIYWQKHVDSTFFVGLMLTTDYSRPDNLKMLAQHFGCGFIYNNTHVVNAFLLKPNEWGPFRKIGCLTQSGLKFIEENVDTSNPKIWTDYLSK